MRKTKTMTSDDRETFFTRIADRVSYGMGTPLNIGVWIVLVAGWIGLFATHVLGPTTNILPGWFTSNAFNFPLNTVTTLAELYIGFLVAAAANRSERQLKSILTDLLDDEKLDQRNEAQIQELLQRIDMQHMSPMKQMLEDILQRMRSDDSCPSNTSTSTPKT